MTRVFPNILSQALWELIQGQQWCTVCCHSHSRTKYESLRSVVCMGLRGWSCPEMRKVQDLHSANGLLTSHILKFYSDEWQSSFSHWVDWPIVSKPNVWTIDTFHNIGLLITWTSRGWKWLTTGLISRGITSFVCLIRFLLAVCEGVISAFMLSVWSGMAP